jgi:hypothetical protein
MKLSNPPPFGAENNPHRTDPADTRLTYNYNCCGRKTEFPCGGYLKLLGTPQGRAVASWDAGSKQTFNLTGTGNHYGGSCQVGFSVDKGKTFQVVKSYEGNCPHRTGGMQEAGQNFDFTVPADMPAGDAVFAWTWVNREAEFYMNCAAVSIKGGSAAAPGSKPPGLESNATIPIASPTSKPTSYVTNGCTCTCDAPKLPARRMHKHKRHGDAQAAAQAGSGEAPAVQDSADKPKSTAPVKPSGGGTVPYSSRPGMLFSDIGNGCSSPKSSAELRYPNPGPDVQPGDGAYPLALPTGEACGASNGPPASASGSGPA